MWPLRIENPIYLEQIYGNQPDLSQVEVTSAQFKRDGATLNLSFISKILPYRPPSRWGQFNAVIFELDFFPLTSLSLRKFGTNGFSCLRMWDEDGSILLTCEGAVQLTTKCQYLRIEKISGVLQSL
jgi:hypothetical protein